MLLLALLSNFMGDDLRSVLSRKCLWTGSSHVNTDCSHKVRRVEAFDGHRIALLKKLIFFKIGHIRI